VASPINPHLTDLSSAFWERVPARGVGAENAIIEQFPSRLTGQINPTIQMQINLQKMRDA
jgi:hypothetical protein